MKEVSCQIENGIAVVSINRPQALNALSRQIVDEMDRIADAVAEDPGIKVLVFHSEGNFAAGADIADMASCDEQEAKEFSFSPTFNKIEALEIPTIAAIEGYALGGGMELALACDLRIAADNAKMGFPEITLGIMPGAGGTVRATKLIGIAAAKEMIFMGAPVTADKAERLGLVNAVVPREEVLPLAMKWAEKMGRLSPVALRTAKETVNEAFRLQGTVQGVALEAEKWAGLFRTADQKEGMRAFLEKRKPVFRGE